ncbi:MAG: hypothetical protein AB1767_07690 [Bacillota bacterium]
MGNENLGVTQNKYYIMNRLLSFDIVLIFMLLLALALAVTMAVISDYDSHPDEKVHFEAVKYYSGNNWLPPVIGAPETLESYSVYGHSRLNELGFYYFLAGKFTAVFSPVTGSVLLSARLFNIFLLLTLIILCIKTPGKHRLLFGVLLLTPQIWYMFSYVNSDAFALFLTIVITAQLVLEDSLLKQYLNSPSYTHGLYKSIPIIVLLLFLYFTKDNFYVYFIFLFAWGAWLLYVRVDRKKLIIKYTIMVVIFLILIAARHNLDYALYGPDKGQDLKEMQEITASDEYKPSARSIGEGHPNLNLDDKGLSYPELFAEPYNWHRGTFYTFTGAYGHMQLFGSATYYQLLFLLYLLMAATISLVLWKGGVEARFSFIFTILLAVLTVYLASMHSWTSDFQPQGRYLFPLLGVIAFLFGRYCKELRRHVVFNVSVLTIAGLSVYSFIAYGLIHIPK